MLPLDIGEQTLGRNQGRVNTQFHTVFLTLGDAQQFDTVAQLLGVLDVRGFDGMVESFAASAHRFRPIGDTDSERAFCLLLERIAPLWEGDAVPSLATRLAVVEQFAAEMRPLGIANFLYSDGEFVFGHGHRRTQADGNVAPPGLWLRHRHNTGLAPSTLATSGVTIHPNEHQHHEPQEMALLASVPVTTGGWRPLAEGEIVVVSAGELIHGHAP